MAKILIVVGSFKNIDPTPSHSSSHPADSKGTITFSIRDTEAEAPNTVSISEVVTRHLKRLASSASDYLGKQVTAAVIAVPTDFTEAQKSALTASAKSAGLEVLQYIPEPVAALLAHDSRATGPPADRTVVVADIGGIRSDVAVISVKGGMYSVLATAHDYAVGGAKLDDVLIDYFAKEFQKKHKADSRANARSLAKLRLEAEACKKALSIGQTAAFNVESLADGIDYSQTINRTRFELLGSKVFARIAQLIADAIAKAALDPLDIDTILLAGGSAHIPRIASTLRSRFTDTTAIVAPSTDPAAINPSELTPRGAAQQASLIAGFETAEIEQSTHAAVAVTPHLARPLGLVAADGAFVPVIPAETPLPVRRTLAFTSGGGEAGALLRVVEGVREIRVTKVEAGAGKAGRDDDDEDDDDEDDDDDDEDDEVREKVWTAGGVVGELALRGVPAGGKVVLAIQVGVDLEVTVSAAAAGQPGVKGVVPGAGVNGVA